MQRARRMAVLVDIHADVLSEIIEYGQKLRHALRRHEAPLKLSVDGEFFGVARDRRRRVVGGVQTDADEAHPPRESGIAPYTIAQFGERRVRKRATQWIDAVGVEERQQRDLTLGQCREPHGTVRAVEQNRVRDALDLLQPVAPGRRRHELHARRGRPAGVHGGARDTGDTAERQHRKHAGHRAERPHQRAEALGSEAMRCGLAVNFM